MEMLMSFFILLVIGVLCLFFKTTRLIGVTGLTLLFLVFPFAFLILLLLVSVIFYFNYKWRLRSYVQPKLPR